MENASKALIIAGAILLSILIISLGIMIFNQAKGAMDGNNMDAVAMENFNSQFTQYEGERVKGSTINSMLNKVVTSNLAEEDDNRRVIVTDNTNNGASIAKGATQVTKKMPTGSTYKVTCTISDGNDNATTGACKANKGLVCQIQIDNVTN